MQGQPSPKKKVQPTPQTPQVAKPAPPVDLSDNPFATQSTPDLSDNPFAESASGDADPMAKYHADFKSGALQKRISAANSRDQAALNTDSSVGNWITTLAPPGVKNAVATVRADLEPGHTFVNPFTEDRADRDQRIAIERQAIDRVGNKIDANSPRVFGANGPGIDLPIIGNPLNPKLSTLGKMAVGAPFAAALPGGMVAQAAQYGGASGVLDDQPDASLGHHLMEGGKDALEAAFLGKLGQGVGQLASKIGASTGLTDALSTALAKAKGSPLGTKLSDLAESLGTKGAVNQVAADRQALTDAVGGGESPADLLARRVKEGRAVASPLYDAARAQANTLEGAPAAVKSRLDEILANAEQKALPAPGQSEITRQAAAEGLAGHDYTQGASPTLEQAAAHDFTATTPPTEPFRDNGLLQSDFTKERPVNLRAANDVNVRTGTPSPTEMGEVTVGPKNQFAEAEQATQTALSNPHVQMQIKSLMGDAPSLKGQDPGSYDVLRKVQANMNAEFGKLKASGQDSGPYWHELNGARADVNAALLAKAPALADANATFAREVGIPREGITKGQTMGANPAGKAAFKRSPDAISQWIAEGKTPAEQSARADAVSAGVGANMGQKISGVPLQSGTRGALDLPMLQGSEAAAGGRALLTPARRQALEATLASLDQRSATEAANMAPRSTLESLWKGPAEYNYLGTSKLPSPNATGPLRETANAMQDGSLDLAPFMRGKQTLQQLQDAIRALSVARSGQMAAP